MEKLSDLISQVNSIDVLKTVYENPGINQRDASGIIGQNSKIKRLKEFVEAGLIREESISVGRTEKKYYLTPEGERVIKGWLLIEAGDFGERTDHGSSSGARHKIKG